ncbi:succinyl-diaminopimelate desuccinylase [Ponticaulis profundi]|uniref:Succinyl-diaminopimelate desuccinylase n=1 Tax=Ponticaulis profundi TaxID=2665222 RepID=A0ABW1S6S7_9PROT
MTDLKTSPLAFAQDLIRCPSITPVDEGALDVLQKALEGLGFTCKRYPFEDVDNLYARLGTEAPNFCFAGHTDVVPVGDAEAWSVDPFAGEVRDGQLIARGAVDMKSQIAAFVTAVARHLETHGRPKGSISFLITGDEEGPAVNGTKKLLKAIHDEGEVLTDCLVGEPTSESRLADVIKNGRRGSLNGKVVVTGKQGHVAYPQKAANPVPALLEFLGKLTRWHLDDGAPGFQTSNLEVTSVDVGNAAHNVIPAKAEAKFNIRFNTNHTGDMLKQQITDFAKDIRVAGTDIALDLKVTGEAFYTEPGRLTDILIEASKHVTGNTPALTTGGGTSDARFIKDYCAVAELGLKNETAHKVDEFTVISELEQLADIYTGVLARYFEA